KDKPCNTTPIVLVETPTHYLLVGGTLDTGYCRHLLQGLGASWILISMPDYVKAAKEEEKTNLNKFSSTQADEQNGTNVMDIKENVERPIDLYKAIFSNDSGDEDESSTNTNQPSDLTTKIEVASTTLTRIVAGEFLESLGMKLGLEDGYFGDESAEVVISSLRLGPVPPQLLLDEVNLNRTSYGGNNSSDNEVVVGEVEELVTCNNTFTSDPNPFIQENKETDRDLKMVENPDVT
ncbi:hypothetical protein Tco_1334065, partial [Tanacetum coccineum]